VILTYLVVVELPDPDQLPPNSLVIVPVTRAALARGEALAPPQAIGVEAVLEHTLGHLAWLIRDDHAIADALPDRSTVLNDYQPEPFRSLD
jgi:hypothetical protein